MQILEPLLLLFRQFLLLCLLLLLLLLLQFFQLLDLLLILLDLLRHFLHLDRNLLILFFLLTHTLFPTSTQSLNRLDRVPDHDPSPVHLQQHDHQVREGAELEPKIIAAVLGANHLLNINVILHASVRQVHQSDQHERELEQRFK